jgi:hypothetical protein
MRCCRFCLAKALDRVHRTLWQKCILSRVYKCRGCGRHDYVLRLLPALSFWSDDCLRGPRYEN